MEDKNEVIEAFVRLRQRENGPDADFNAWETGFSKSIVLGGSLIVEIEDLDAREAVEELVIALSDAGFVVHTASLEELTDESQTP